MPKVAYDLIHPETRSTSVVFASPHSGDDYPWSFLRRTELDKLTIRSSEDAFVNRLFDCAPQFGAPFMRAGAPRAFVDLNRSAEELDPALIEGASRQGHNPRIASGLGVIPRGGGGGGGRSIVASCRWQRRNGVSISTGDHITRCWGGDSLTRRAPFLARRFWWIVIRCRTRRWTRSRAA